ncbi:MAG: hypothetical protein ACFFDN_09255 [Candidatus Hodarchaeota archaeon]
MKLILSKNMEGNIYYYPKPVRDNKRIVCEAVNLGHGLCYRRKKVYLYKVSILAISKYEYLCLRCVVHLKQKGWNVELIE